MQLKHTYLHLSPTKLTDLPRLNPVSVTSAAAQLFRLITVSPEKPLLCFFFFSFSFHCVLCACTSLRDGSTYLKTVGAKQSKPLGKAYESANEHNMGTLKRLISLRIQPHSSDSWWSGICGCNALFKQHNICIKKSGPHQQSCVGIRLCEGQNALCACNIKQTWPTCISPIDSHLI